MKTHLSKVTPNRFGGFNTSTLCDRFARASSDGFNSTDEVAKVTCKFCLTILKRSAQQHGEGR